MRVGKSGGDADDLTGWTALAGAWALSTGAVGIAPRTGSRFFYGTTANAQLQQDCAVDPGDEVGHRRRLVVLAVSVWVATAGVDDDRGGFEIIFLDGVGGNTIGIHPTQGNSEIESQRISPGRPRPSWRRATGSPAVTSVAHRGDGGRGTAARAGPVYPLA
jgi:hypothetical protein